MPRPSKEDSFDRPGTYCQDEGFCQTYLGSTLAPTPFEGFIAPYPIELFVKLTGVSPKTLAVMGLFPVRE